jgi:hypothetical protein
MKPAEPGAGPKYPRRTPISWELRQVLEEIRAEQRKIPNVGGYVFTRKNGQPIESIRTAFEKARHEAKLDHVIFHVSEERRSLGGLISASLRTSSWLQAATSRQMCMTAISTSRISK